MWTDSGRLQWIFDSPIFAATFFAAIAPWAFLLSAREWRLRMWIGYAVTLVLISGALSLSVLTQSRGPLIALTIAISCGLSVRKRFCTSPIILWASILCFGLVLLLPAVLGMGSRISPEAISGDGSVQNRLFIWSSSLDMIFQDPIWGIGKGEAGYFFSQWYQPESLSYLYAGVFNEYLQLGIERGLPALFIVVLGISFVFLVPFQLPVADSNVGASFLDFAAFSAFISLIVLVVAGLFSVTSGAQSIKALACLDLAVLGLWLFRLRRSGAINFKRPTILAGLGACFLMVLLGVAAWMHRPPDISVVRESPQLVRLRKTSAISSAARVATILVDRESMGLIYGKEMRRWLLNSGSFDEFLVVDPRFPVPDSVLNRTPTIILPGRTARFSCQLNPGVVKSVILLHPRSITGVPRFLSIPAVAFLPKISEDGSLSLKWGENQVVKTTKTVGDSLVGVDLRL